MKILSIGILQTNVKPCKIIAAEYELNEFGYFKRGGIQEFLSFFMVTLTEKTSAGVRQSVQEEGNVGHVYVQTEGLSCVIVTDQGMEWEIMTTFI